MGFFLWDCLVRIIMEAQSLPILRSLTEVVSKADTMIRFIKVVVLVSSGFYLFKIEKQLSLLLFFIFSFFSSLIDLETAILNSDKNVCILSCRCYKFCHNELRILSSPHSQRLEALQTILVNDVKWFESICSMLHKICQKCCKLNFFHSWVINKVVLHRDS